MPENFQEAKAGSIGTDSNHGQINLLDVSHNPNDRVMPTARLMGLAGTVGGVTELTFNHLNMTAVGKLEQAAAALGESARHGSVSFTAVDALTAHRGSILNSMQLESAGFSAATNARVTSVLEAADNFARSQGKVGGQKLWQSSHELHSGLLAETQMYRNSAGSAFLNGFGKGVVGMGMGIGFGYVTDKMLGQDDSTMQMNSPLGLACDAGAGLAMVSNLPMKYKVPLALAAIAVPRVLSANEMDGGLLRGTTMSGGSPWQPNAVDAIGIGLAAGLPVNGGIKLSIGFGALIAGRVYNAYNYVPLDQRPLLGN